MLLGRNGAGKTTTLRTIMGLWRARAGKIVFDGQSIAALETPHIARLGIAYVPEKMGIFGKLTVRENMLLATAPRGFAAAAARPRAGKLSGAEGEMGLGRRLAVRRAEADAGDRPRHHRAAPAAAGGRADQGPVAGDGRSAGRRACCGSKPSTRPSCWSSRIFTWREAVGDDVAVMDEGRIIHTGAMAALAADDALQHRLLGPEHGGQRMNGDWRDHCSAGRLMR